MEFTRIAKKPVRGGEKERQDPRREILKEAKG
jgi:hypothetical protein